ncbi:MAG: HAMP domain-containing protein [Bdellovibrionales bacterium]|nr:HAMP domain-containing protein [Bdellovibrionales bacterium]
MVSRRKRFALWWSRAGISVRLTLFVVCTVLLGVLVYLQRPLNDDTYLVSNVAVFALVNINVAILVILIFLVGRNVVKLFFDRRRGMLGSRLRLRLVGAFVGLTLIPSVVLVFLASGLLSRAIDGWFSSPAESSVDGALEVARIHFRNVEDRVLESTKQVALNIQAKQLTLGTPEELKQYLESERERVGLYGILVLGNDGVVKMSLQNAAAEIENFSIPPVPKNLSDLSHLKNSKVFFEETETSQFIRAVVPVVFLSEPAALLSTHRIEPELAHALTLVRQSFKEYEQLKLFKHPLKSVYILTLYMFTGLIIFGAIWIGMYIARELTGPIQRLAEGTREVARGNYDFHIRKVGDDEIGGLIESFNQMTRDLKSTSFQSEQRKIHLETIMAHLAVGVMTLDRTLTIRSMNQASLGLFQVETERAVVGRNLFDLLPEELQPAFSQLIDSLGEESSTAEQEVRFVGKNEQEHDVLVTVGTLLDPRNEWTGYIVLLDDITALSQAQRMSAWREAAKRIAHEIKNPLTPIRLVAQRLRKNLGDNTEVGPTIRDASDTIVENVDSIKRLADEFSKFARMPQSELQETDLPRLVSDLIADFSGQHPEIQFHCISDSDLPKIVLDREQIRRLFINLIDNAVDALSSSMGSIEKHVEVRIHFDHRSNSIRVELSDNGPGIPEKEKSRIFQPYVTTKEKGTGLGLAIAASAVHDHHGNLYVQDNFPRGAKFIIELPVGADLQTKRRLVRGGGEA